MRITKTFKSDTNETDLLSTAVLEEQTNEFVVEAWTVGDYRVEIARFPFTPGRASLPYSHACSLARRVAQQGY